MRLLSGILLTALIFLNLFGFYGLFIFKQADIKQEMAQEIANNSSTPRQQLLNFDNQAFSKLIFTDNDKEFQLEGKLYDVVSIEHVGNQVKVTVEYDSKETDLVAVYTSTWNQQEKNQNSSPTKTTISHFQQDYIAQQQPVQAIYRTNTIALCSLCKQYAVSSTQSGNLTPPPQFFLV